MNLGLLQRCVDVVTDHNRITLLVMLVLTVGVLAGIPQIDTESQAGGTSSQFDHIDRVQKAQYIQEQYANATAEQSVRVLQPVYVWDEDGNVLSKSALLDGLRYQQDLREHEDVRRTLHEDGISGIENLVATRLANDPNATLDEQIHHLENASAGTVSSVVEDTIAQDQRAPRYLPQGHDGSATATDRRILVTLDGRSTPENRDAADSALYEITQERSGAGFFVVNSPAWNAYSDHFFGQMFELVLPVALLLILLILVFAYRDLVDVVVGMTGVVLSVLWMFGLLGWLSVEAGTISIVPVVLITGLSIDFGFHVFNRYREQRGPEDPIRGPMARGLRLVATALILVTVTAAIGFLANLANPLPVIRDLGVSITLGVVSALVIFVTVVPALKISIDGLLERVGLDRRKKALGHGTYLKPVLERTVTLAQRAAPAVLVVALIIGALGGLAWTQLEEESFQQSDGEVAEWKQSLPGPLGWDTEPLPQQEQHVQEVYQPADADAAIQSQILVQGDVTGETTLEDIDTGVQLLRDRDLIISQPGTRAVRSPTTAMQAAAEQNESFAAVLEGADTDGNGVPDQNIEAVYDAFYAADSDAAARVVERSNGEYRSVLVTVSLDASFGDGDEIVPQLDEAAARMGEDEGRTATAAGTLEVNTAVLDEIVGGIVLTMLIALVAIIATMTVVFRSIHGSATLGAIVSLPIVLVVGLVIGGMYLLDIPLTLLTALLMSLVIGLGVDYNIHIGDRYADELLAGKQPIESLSAAVTGTGGALVGSTLTSAGAFATITLVPHPQIQSFGSIVVIALVTAFIVSLLVLPSLLVLWSRYIPGSVATMEGPEEDAAAAEPTDD